MTYKHIFSDRLPDYMRAPADAYVETGKPPGDFLYALLSNDLRRAVAAADTENSRVLQTAWVWWLLDIPDAAQGSKRQVDAWISSGGFTGGRPTPLEALKDLLDQLEAIGPYIPGEAESQWADLAGLSFAKAEDAIEAAKEREGQAR